MRWSAKKSSDTPENVLLGLDWLGQSDSVVADDGCFPTLDE